MAGFTRRDKPLKARSNLADLLGLSVTSPANGDLLVYNSADTIWENSKTLTGAYTVVGSLAAQTLTATTGITTAALTVTANATVGGNLTVTGTLTSGNLAIVDLTVSGNSTFAGTVAISGALTGAGFSFSGAGTVSGALTLGSTLSVTGAATLASTLAVTGATTLASSLAVAGATSLTGDVVTWGNVSISGALAAGSLSTPGNAYIGGAATIVGLLTLGDQITFTSGPIVKTGAGSPEAAVTAVIGSLYLRTDGSTGTSVYRKESGSGNTGWVGISSVTSGAIDSAFGSTRGMILYRNATVWTTLAAGTDGQVLTTHTSSSDPTWEDSAAPTPAGEDYANYLCAGLEPDAIEAAQVGTFTYTVNSSTTKLLVASYATRIGSAGRMEQRNPRDPMPLRDMSLYGLLSGSIAILIDPTTATYADPWTTYYDRMQAIRELSVKNITWTATSTIVPFLPGAYGAIIIQNTVFDIGHTAWYPLGGSAYTLDIGNSVGATTTLRIGESMLMPVSKRVGGMFKSNANATGSYLASLSYVLVPSTWSAVTDSNTYAFRDDFMGASLDTGVWSRTQSTAGNVEINTTYQWLKMVGNSSWAGNGLFRTSTSARSAGTKMIVDVSGDASAATNGGVMVGWHDGSGYSYSDFAHGLLFAPGNVLTIYENANSRGNVGSGWDANAIYRVRITQGASSATYEIQGGSQYGAIGSSSWTTLTGSSTSSSTTPLTPGATAYAGTSYISDMRVI